MRKVEKSKRPLLEISKKYTFTRKNYFFCFADSASRTHVLLTRNLCCLNNSPSMWLRVLNCPNRRESWRLAVRVLFLERLWSACWSTLTRALTCTRDRKRSRGSRGGGEAGDVLELQTACVRRRQLALGDRLRLRHTLQPARAPLRALLAHCRAAPIHDAAAAPTHDAGHAGR